MTISGASTPEELIPGNPAAIEAVVENVGAGVAPARQIAGAWQLMTLPDWQGRGGDAWRAFTPKEAGHAGTLPPAFNRVAVAMLRYQSAFQAARAEAQAAITDAKTAEQATQVAKQEHRDAIRKAATADPGTPEATVPPFTDPGATALANAQARLDTARATLARVGDEVAAEIRAAAGTTSGVAPSLNVGNGPSIAPAVGIPPDGLPKPNTEVMDAIGEFLTGFFSEAWDTVVGLAQLLPFVWVPQVFEELFTPEGREREGQKWDAFITDPGGVLGEQWDQIWKSLTYADLWEGHPGQASGRATFAALTLLLPFLKLGKAGTLGTVGKLGKADDIPKLRPLQPGEKLRLGEAARGTSDGGPGLWEKSPTRTKGQDYQEFITGMERGTEYKVNGIDFDGYDKTRNVLLDAKDWKDWPPANQRFWHESTIDQIRRQVMAANGTKIEWHLSTQAAKDAVDKMLRGTDVAGQITTVYTPFG